MYIKRKGWGEGTFKLYLAFFLACGNYGERVDCRFNFFFFNVGPQLYLLNWSSAQVEISFTCVCHKVPIGVFDDFVCIAGILSNLPALPPPLNQM